MINEHYWQSLFKLDVGNKSYPKCLRFSGTTLVHVLYTLISFTDYKIYLLKYLRQSEYSHFPEPSEYFKYE